jgi:hypothetical protein
MNAGVLELINWGFKFTRALIEEVDFVARDITKG